MAGALGRAGPGRDRGTASCWVSPSCPGPAPWRAGRPGAYDQYFTTLARNLVSDGEANAILRLGWEFNGYWYPWYVQTLDRRRQFRHVLAAHRHHHAGRRRPAVQVPVERHERQHQHGLLAVPVYPGDAYVDYIGTDNYDDFWGTPFTPAAAWSNQLTQQWGLNWLASFAAAHGKPIAIPEWSVEYRDDGHGLGDDPSFIDQHGRLVRRPPRGLRRHLLLRLVGHVPQRHPRRHLPELPGRVQGPSSAERHGAVADGARSSSAPPAPILDDHDPGVALR